MPLVSTSANCSKIRPAKTYRECLRMFGDEVLVLPGLTSFAKRPSTVIDLETKRILR
jgi:L-threonylcarbamoyladenylate synthase